ncbi:hypothetical protein TCAL_08891, partial [Tigriopus californicus]
SFSSKVALGGDIRPKFPGQISCLSRGLTTHEGFDAQCSEIPFLALLFQRPSPKNNISRLYESLFRSFASSRLLDGLAVVVVFIMVDLRSNASFWERAYVWCMGGVNWHDPEEGGPECLNHVSEFHRRVEIGIGVVVTLLSLWIGVRTCQGQDQIVHSKRPRGPYSPSGGKMLLLVLFTLIFGIEVGYKFTSGHIIYLLYPCHVNSILWIYVLATPPTWGNVCLYRLILHFTHGTLAGIYFPVDEVLKLPFERETYWLQHYFLVIIPVYMICFERWDYPPSPKWDISWIFLSFSAWSFWHFVVMHGVSVLTLANIGHMLCAAFSDPFRGPYYRMIGILHQLLATALSGLFVGSAQQQQQHQQQLLVPRDLHPILVESKEKHSWSDHDNGASRAWRGMAKFHVI